MNDCDGSVVARDANLVKNATTLKYEWKFGAEFYDTYKARDEFKNNTQDSQGSFGYYFIFFFLRGVCVVFLSFQCFC